MEIRWDSRERSVKNTIFSAKIPTDLLLEINSSASTILHLPLEMNSPPRASVTYLDTTAPPPPQKKKQTNCYENHCLRFFHCVILKGVGSPNPGLPRKQKIGVKAFWVQTSEIGEECRRFWA